MNVQRNKCWFRRLDGEIYLSSDRTNIRLTLTHTHMPETDFVSLYIEGPLIQHNFCSVLNYINTCAVFCISLPMSVRITVVGGREGRREGGMEGERETSETIRAQQSRVQIRFSLLSRFPLVTKLTFCMIIRKRDHQNS